MSKKKIFLFVVGAFVFLCILGIVFEKIDYNRVHSGENPIFCIRTHNKQNTKESCWGLGYKWEKETNVSLNDPLYKTITIKFGLWINPKTLTTEGKYGNNDNKSCDNNIDLIHQAEDEYYSNTDNLNFPFTIEIVEKKNCNDTKELYYTGTDYNIYLFCLDEVIINFDNESISLKEALENNKITMNEIEKLIPYQVHLYYGKDSYIHSDKYGFAKNGISIYYSSLGRYFIGPIAMCDDGSFDGILNIVE